MPTADGTIVSEFPALAPIDLSGLGQVAGAALMADRNPWGARGGFWDLVLGAARDTSGLGTNFLLGQNGGDANADGVLDCEDFRDAKMSGAELGLMLQLMCSEVFEGLADVVSLAFSGDGSGGAMAVSFADYSNGKSATGFWNRGLARSYPAEIRLWMGPSLENLDGFAAIDLASIYTGGIHLHGITDDGKSRHDGVPAFGLSIDFDYHDTATDCRKQPSKNTCQWQSTKIYRGDAEVEDGPNSLHLTVFADRKKDPSFIAMEGKYAYAPATAARFIAESDPCYPELKKLRSIYVTAVQVNQEIWGQFKFRDGTGNLLSCIDTATQADALSTIARGICVDLSNTDQDPDRQCRSFKAEQYQFLWRGEAAVDLVTSSPAKSDFVTNKPQEQAVCTVAGCTPF